MRLDVDAGLLVVGVVASVALLFLEVLRFAGLVGPTIEKVVGLGLVVVMLLSYVLSKLR